MYYWPAFFICILASFLGGGFSRAAGGATGVNQAQMNEAMQSFEATTSQMSPQALLYMMLALVVGMSLAVLISLLMGAFIGNVARVGCCRFFIESRDQNRSAGVGRLFSAFGGGHYLNVVKTMFLKELFVILWSFLLVIPGIIKAYQYALVPYILAESPQMPWRDALQLSKELMEGHKLELFLLELSFIGWYLLGALVCGVGVLFVNPYSAAAEAEFYAARRQGAGAAGYVYY